MKLFIRVSKKRFIASVQQAQDELSRITLALQSIPTPTDRLSDWERWLAHEDRKLRLRLMNNFLNDGHWIHALRKGDRDA